jgi:AraC family transcriptional regulator
LDHLLWEVEVDHRVRQTIDRIDEQLHRRLTVNELAESVSISVGQLTRLFRRATGLTPGAFLRARRMERARILLERTSLPVSEVMAQVGITDRSHFARDFSREYGASPRGFRLERQLTRSSARAADV